MGTTCTRMVLLGAAALLCALAPLGAAHADSVAATVTAHRGEVAAGAATQRPLGLRSAIELGELVTTASDAELSMLLSSGDAAVDLCGDTKLALTDAQGAGARIASVESGVLQAFVDPKASPARLEIHTPAAVAVVLGTAVQVMVSADTGHTTVVGLGAPVRVSSTAGGSDSDTTVCCGQAVDVAPGAPASRSRSLRRSESAALERCFSGLHGTAAAADRRAAASSVLDLMGQSERPQLAAGREPPQAPAGRSVAPETPCYTPNCVAGPTLVVSAPPVSPGAAPVAPPPPIVESPSPITDSPPPPPPPQLYPAAEAPPLNPNLPPPPEVRPTLPPPPDLQPGGAVPAQPARIGDGAPPAPPAGSPSPAAPPIPPVPAPGVSPQPSLPSPPLPPVGVIPAVPQSSSPAIGAAVPLPASVPPVTIPEAPLPPLPPPPVPPPIAVPPIAPPIVPPIAAPPLAAPAPVPVPVQELPTNPPSVESGSPR